MQRIALYRGVGPGGTTHDPRGPPRRSEAGGARLSQERIKIGLGRTPAIKIPAGVSPSPRARVDDRGLVPGERFTSIRPSPEGGVVVPDLFVQGSPPKITLDP